VNLNLLFYPQVQLETQRLTFRNSNIAVQNLNLFGSLAFYRCNVTIINSHILPNQNDKEFVILADNYTTLIASNLVVDSNHINSIGIDNHSFSSFSNCQISNFLRSITIKNESKAFFVNCQIHNCEKVVNSQFFEATNSSHAQVIEISFLKYGKDAILLFGESFLEHFSLHIQSI
jgi:hypothetical protein